MARSLVLGNSALTVTLDKHARLRDFYFPYVGLENHLGAADVHLMGVWVDGAFSWISQDEWDIRIDYSRETLVSNIEALHHTLDIRLTFQDFVYNEANVYVRDVLVENRANHKRDIRVYFNQQFTIGQTNHADTAYYNPKQKAIIHYKGRRVILIGGRADGAPFEDYSIGLSNTEGREGTWRDAEDGDLSRNPIEHGSVDSVIGFSFRLGPHETRPISYWITVAETYKEAKRLHHLVERKTPRHILKSTSDFWNAWVNKRHYRFPELDDDVVKLYKKSLLILRAHADQHGGILASVDGADTDFGRDTYGYVWPRDGAFIANAFDCAGYEDIAHRFFEFSHDVLTDDGYILHKYQPDRSLGSSWHPWIQEGQRQLAIQEDETALLLWSFWQHYRLSKDLEFVEEIYNSYIKRISDFLVSYRDPETGLPAPSYDLWEEKYGVSTFTASAVYGALTAGANFADLLGKEEDGRLYRDIAEEMKQAIITHLYHDDIGFFVKMMQTGDDGGDRGVDRTIDASSFFGVFQFNVLPPRDDRLERARETMTAHLSDPVPSSGVVRYDGDEYRRRDSATPGNPWFVTTLWNVQYSILRANRAEDLAAINADLKWVVNRASQAGMLSEQVDPNTGEQLSVVPLAWSHAEYVRTVTAYMHKLERLGVCHACEPQE